MNEWNSLECPNCGADGAIHTIYGVSNHEINCGECDLIDRDDELNCADCGVI